MRNPCCAVDPTDSTCSTVDCSKPTTGKCVLIPECDGDDKYFFNEFKGRCEYKGHCPPFFEWSERSRKCETYNPCDQASDQKKQQYGTHSGEPTCVEECSGGMEFDEAMMRCKCPADSYFYLPEPNSTEAE